MYESEYTIVPDHENDECVCRRYPCLCGPVIIEPVVHYRNIALFVEQAQEEATHAHMGGRRDNKSRHTTQHVGTEITLATSGK